MVVYNFKLLCHAIAQWNIRINEHIYSQPSAAVYANWPQEINEIVIKLFTLVTCSYLWGIHQHTNMLRFRWNFLRNNKRIIFCVSSQVSISRSLLCKHICSTNTMIVTLSIIMFFNQKEWWTIYCLLGD